MVVAARSHWKDATVYQIWPTSFKDSNGDGIGDIPGIISSLDYLKYLGIDIIWLSPMYESPQFDMGYDISNYQDIYPPFGTLADMDMLIKECHERGLKIIIDLVVNHTSHLHAWFKESSSSKDNPKRDWYIWKPAKYDNGKRLPPNNWKAAFGGSAWEWHEGTQEYYLHLFVPEQPDLNWENEETRNAIYENTMVFWLEKGVDGFRVDVGNFYSKTPGLPDAPVTDPESEYQRPGEHVINGPRMHEFMLEIYDKVMSKYPDAFTVGELVLTTEIPKILSYVGSNEKQYNMIFSFEMVYAAVVPVRQGKKYDLIEFKKAYAQPQKLLTEHDAWAAIVLENHDVARSISLLFSDAPEYRVACGKLLAMLLTTASGTLFMYQGEEIGMVNMPADWPIEEYRDVATLNRHNEALAKQTSGNADALAKATTIIQKSARDHARTPMQWDDSLHGGFTTGPTPWMRAHDNASQVNVKQQIGDKTSLLAFWRSMLKLRKDHSDTFVYGDFELHDLENPHTLTYVKRSGEKEKHIILCVMNFTSQDREFSRPKEFEGATLKLWVSNLRSVEAPAKEAEGEGKLAPFEARLYAVEI